MAGSAIHAPMILRGEIVEGADGGAVEHEGRRGGARFTTPDAREHLDRLPLRAPSLMGDLNALSFDDILDFLEGVGERLDLDRNRHLQEAFELSCDTSGLS